VYHSTLGLGVIKKKKKDANLEGGRRDHPLDALVAGGVCLAALVPAFAFTVWGSGFEV